MPLSKQASLSPDFLALLACPETNQSLMYKDESLVTDPSNFEQIQLEKKHRKYPLIGGIPWLIPYPRNSLLDWGAKLNQFQQVFLREISGLNR